MSFPNAQSLSLSFSVCERERDNREGIVEDLGKIYFIAGASYRSPHTYTLNRKQIYISCFPAICFLFLLMQKV
jgi:hypothetical protein